MILSSIALEEVALSHIINAEGEKIQYILSQTNCGQHSADLKDILAVNKSVTNLLEMVLQNQIILKSKMEKVLEHLPKPPSPPNPPKPPCPPFPPEPPCPPAGPCVPSACCTCGQPACFRVIPKSYGCNEPLQWSQENIRGRFGLYGGDCSKIQLPRTGSFMVDLYLDFCNSKDSSREIMLMIFCEDKCPIVKRIYPNPCDRPTASSKSIVVQLPCSCSPCYGSLFVCAPGGAAVRQGKIAFTKV